MVFYQLLQHQHLGVEELLIALHFLEFLYDLPGAGMLYDRFLDQVTTALDLLLDRGIENLLLYLHVLVQFRADLICQLLLADLGIVTEFFELAEHFFHLTMVLGKQSDGVVNGRCAAGF